MALKWKSPWSNLYYLPLLSTIFSLKSFFTKKWHKFCFSQTLKILCTIYVQSIYWYALLVYFCVLLLVLFLFVYALFSVVVYVFSFTSHFYLYTIYHTFLSLYHLSFLLSQLATHPCPPTPCFTCYSCSHFSLNPSLFSLFVCTPFAVEHCCFSCQVWFHLWLISCFVNI